MKQFIAIYFAAIGAIYSDFESNDIVKSYGLPVVFVVSMIYLFTPAGSMILFTAGIFFYFTDVLSPSVFKSIVLPLLFCMSLLWFILWAWKTGHLQTNFSGGGGFGGDSGGDCGGGGDC